MQPERRLVKQAQALLKARGARAIKIHGGDNPYQEAGIADLIVCYRGRFLALEAKTPSGHPSRIQELFLNSISTADGYACIFTNVGQISKLLDEIDEEEDE